MGWSLPHPPLTPLYVDSFLFMLQMMAWCGLSVYFVFNEEYVPTLLFAIAALMGYVVMIKRGYAPYAK